MDRSTVYQSLKRFIPFRSRLFFARERWRRAAALRRARRGAEEVIQRAKQLRATDPSRPICGILLVEHMGDIIACEPVTRWARKRYPTSRIVWVTKPAYAELLTSHPDIEAVLTVRSLASVPAIVQSGVFDATIDLHVNSRATDIEDVRYTKTWGNPAIDTTTYLRERSLIGALSKAAGIEELSGEASLHIPPAAKETIDRLNLPASFVVVHTTSNDPARDWTTEAWQELAAYIVDAGLHVIEVGTDSRLAASSGVTSYCGRLRVIESAELIRRARFFIGIDSGPAHMANVWHTPSLILLSRFHGHDWRPYEGFFVQQSERVLLRHTGHLASLSVSHVIDRLRHDEDWMHITGAISARRLIL
jgi:ADP-heptose:LPS heptosyltransferase